MEIIVTAYIVYLVISMALTIWVGRSLFKHGQPFLDDIFHGQDLAKSVNRLLLTGFYLLNIGFVVINLKIMGEMESYRGLFESLSLKTGAVILVLGCIHFFNLIILFKLRKRAIEGPRPPKYREPVKYFEGAQ